MDLENKDKEELIGLVKYYKSEWDNVSRALRQRNKDITNLKKENTKLKNEIEELKKMEGESNNNIELLC